MVEWLLQTDAPMTVMVSKHDLQHSRPEGLNHPIARALHFRPGNFWHVSDDERSASETVAPFRVVPLLESVPLAMQSLRHDDVVQPFEFEIPDQFDSEAP